MELIKVHQYFIIMFSIFKPMLYNMTHTVTQWVTCDQTTLQHHQLLHWWSLIRNVCTLLNIIFLLWKLTYFLFSSKLVTNVVSLFSSSYVFYWSQFSLLKSFSIRQCLMDGLFSIQMRRTWETIWAGDKQIVGSLSLWSIVMISK